MRPTHACKLVTLFDVRVVGLVALEEDQGLPVQAFVYRALFRFESLLLRNCYGSPWCLGARITLFTV